jgi:uncharacterized protein (DUF427 family)
VEAVFEGHIVAASEHTIVVEGNHFPPEAVRWEYLTRTRMKTLCPWKGIASYYTVSAYGKRRTTG